MQRITPFLWFDDQAEEAVALYTSVFRNSMIKKRARYSAEAARVANRPENSVMTVEFELDGHAFTALNGGPVFQFTEAISFVVNCERQEEVDEFWEKLSAGGQKGQCGWLKDRFGVSWQIVPNALDQLLASDDEEKSKRVMSAMLKMTKLDIKELQKAYDGA